MFVVISGQYRAWVSWSLLASIYWRHFASKLVASPESPACFFGCQGRLKVMKAQLTLFLYIFRQLFSISEVGCQYKPISDGMKMHLEFCAFEHASMKNSPNLIRTGLKNLNLLKSDDGRFLALGAIWKLFLEIISNNNNNNSKWNFNLHYIIIVNIFACCNSSAFFWTQLSWRLVQTLLPLWSWR